VRDLGPLEGEQVFKLHAVADVAVRRLASTDDAAGALNNGTRATDWCVFQVSAWCCPGADGEVDATYSNLGAE
jgi:hypothetical protein